MKHKILVTGGLGYIGSHTVVKLIEAGYNPVIIDNLSNSEMFILERIAAITGHKPPFYQLDLCDYKAVAHFFDVEKNIQAVIHFAAFKSVSESVSDPLKYYNNNLLSLTNVLQCMEYSGVGNMVFSSSATVYGQPDKLPITENTPFKKALSAYGDTKQMGEAILEKVSAAKEMNVIALRYFNPVGAHPTSLIGEMPRGIPGNLMPFVTQTGIGKRERLTVFGNDYNTVDGTCVRDYIHVMDLAAAHVTACERLLSGLNAERLEVFNLGTGKGSSVMEIVTMFEKVSGIKLSIQIGGRRPGDAESVYADVTAANNILKWKAALNLEEMIASSWEWEKQLSKELLH